MPPLPSDEKLYRAVINLQINQDFEVIRNYIGRRHSEVGGSFHAIKDDMQLHQAQGRAAEDSLIFIFGNSIRNLPEMSWKNLRPGPKKLRPERKSFRRRSCLKLSFALVEVQNDGEQKNFPVVRGMSISPLFPRLVPGEAIRLLVLNVITREQKTDRNKLCR